MEQSVAGLFEQYLARSHLRESSIEITARAVRWFCELHKEIPACSVNFGHADDYRAWLAKDRTENSANTYLRTIKPFFAWMAKRGHIKQDPFDGIRLYSIVEKKYEIYELEEIERMLAVASPVWKLMISLALNSMREAEILNLILNDIDFEKNLITITPKKDTDETWPWDIKDHNQAYIGVPDCVMRLLVQAGEKLQGKQPYLCLPHKRYLRNLELKRQGRLTHRMRNCPWGNFTRDFRRLLKMAIVRPKRFHDLRATFATERYEKEGYDLKELQYLLRHSSIQTTARYIRNINERRLVSKSSKTFDKYYATNVS